MAMELEEMGYTRQQWFVEGIGGGSEVAVVGDIVRRMGNVIGCRITTGIHIFCDGD